VPKCDKEVFEHYSSPGDSHIQTHENEVAPITLALSGAVTVEQKVKVVKTDLRFEKVT
jgi:hypothetical protein